MVPGKVDIILDDPNVVWSGIENVGFSFSVDENSTDSDAGEKLGRSWVRIVNDSAKDVPDSSEDEESFTVIKEEGASIAGSNADTYEDETGCTVSNEGKSENNEYVKLFSDDNPGDNCEDLEDGDAVPSKDDSKDEDGLMLVSRENDSDNDKGLTTVSNEDTSTYDESLATISKEDKSTEEELLMFDSCADDPKDKAVWATVSNEDDSEERKGSIPISSEDGSGYKEFFASEFSEEDSKDNEGLLLVSSIDDFKNKDVCTNVSNKDDSKVDERLMLVSNDVFNSSKYDES